MKAIKYYWLVVLLCGGVDAARAQSTAFNYQGRLALGGLPFHGAVEMQFSLFDAATGGVAIGTSTPAIAAVTVNHGLFSVPLDFGADVFSGAGRFLEIQARTNAGAFVAIAPRQSLTASPSALYAAGAATVTNGSITAGLIASNQVVKSFNGMKDSVNLVPGTNVLRLVADQNLVVAAGPWAPNGNDQFYNAGNVGIGTAAPRAKLDVSGGLMVGDGSYAPGSDEKLRIVRGAIDADGTILQGKGFSSTLIDPGVFRITFDQPFADIPSVIVTPRAGGGSDVPMAILKDLPTPGAVNLKVVFATDNQIHFIAIGPR